MSPIEEVINLIQTVLLNCQSGNSFPTLKDLDECGKLHCVLEELNEYKYGGK